MPNVKSIQLISVAWLKISYWDELTSKFYGTFIWIPEGWCPMGFTKVPWQDKVYFRALSTRALVNGTCRQPGPGCFCPSAALTFWKTLVVPQTSREKLKTSFFLCKMQWLVSVTAKAPFDSEMTGWLLWRWEQSWSWEGPSPRKEASSPWHLCNFLLLPKCCISLRVHKSWHVCKERHGRNSYALPYNKHVVNNLYLEYNLS